jgi:hypothetical protein
VNHDNRRQEKRPFRHAPTTVADAPYRRTIAAQPPARL